MTLGRHVPRAVALAGVVLLVALALGLKGRRYIPGGPPAADGVQAEVERTMDGAGWTIGRTIRFAEGMPMQAEEFRKTGCFHPVTIAFLGRNAELMPYVRLALGSKARLVHIGASDSDSRAGGQLLAVSASTADAECALPPMLGGQREHARKVRLP